MTDDQIIAAIRQIDTPLGRVSLIHSREDRTIVPTYVAQQFAAAIAAQLAAPVAPGSLIAELREHDDARLYQEADVLMSRAADRIAELEAAPVLTPCRHCGFRVALNEAPVAAQDRGYTRTFNAIRKAVSASKPGALEISVNDFWKYYDAAAIDGAQGERQP